MDHREVIERDDFKVASARMKRRARNRNRIRYADDALAALVARGYDPAEVADAWDEHCDTLEASHREPGMWTQLTKWLENSAEDDVLGRRLGSKPASAHRGDPLRGAIASAVCKAVAGGPGEWKEDPVYAARLAESSKAVSSGKGMRAS